MSDILVLKTNKRKKRNVITARIKTNASLSDVDNKVARQFGLVFSLSEQFWPIYQEFGVDLPAFNGSDTFELPVQASYVINQDGVVSTDYC